MKFFIFPIGVIQKPRGQDSDHFWPPTHLTWTGMDISLSTYLCPRGHSWTHLTIFFQDLDLIEEVIFFLIWFLCYEAKYLSDSFIAILYLFVWNMFSPILPAKRFFKDCSLQIHALSFSLKVCPRGHLKDHPPTSRGKSWKFDQPPTHLILSTWFLNDPICHSLLNKSILHHKRTRT